MALNKAAEFPILLVDDEEEILFSTSVLFNTEGFQNVVTESDSRNVMAFLASRPAGLVLLDLNMPHLSGFDLLKEIAASFPQLPVIILTAANQLELAVECMKVGAFDYFVKPVEKNRLLAGVRRALELHSLRNEVSLLTRELLSDSPEQHPAFATMLTRSAKMKSIFRYLMAVARTDQPVLIAGETGVGKELVAQSLHEVSGLSGEFVAVNIAGLDDHMFSDALFGHAKGAFTGADHARDGLVARAAGGTLFLDEIGDLSLSSQVKLLRLLQEKEYYPLGSDKPKRSEARVVVATNCDLARKMEEKTFRKDLYYRLSGHQVRIPPLRERLEDLPLLLESFLAEAAESLGQAKPPYPAELHAYLASYDFPGNLREFKAMVFDAMARHQKGTLSLSRFREAIGTRGTQAGADPLAYLQQVVTEPAPGQAMPTLKEAEAALIRQALKLAKGNQGLAASHLGITRQALNKRLTRKEH